MNYNQLGTSSIKVSALGLGTWAFGGDSWGSADDKASRGAIECALDKGINFIDTAPIYGEGRAETVVGKAIRARRDAVILATKCGLIKSGKKISINLKRESILKEIDASLLRLDTDYIDIYQCHWPDKNTPLEETLETLQTLVSRGKIRYIGLSNYTAEEISSASSLAPITVAQNQCSLLEPGIAQSIVPLCKTKGIATFAYGSLAGGMLTGKYAAPHQFARSDARSFFYRFYSGEGYEKAQRLFGAIARVNLPPATVALTWLTQVLGITSALVGCRNERHVVANSDAVNITLTEEQINTITEAVTAQ